jgi:hypothetical protein
VVSSWATFIGLNYRRRLERVLMDLSSRFSVEDSRRTVIISELRHEKFAEMIGSSRPFITRLNCDTVKQAVLARRGKQYILYHPPQNETNAVEERVDAANTVRRVAARCSDQVASCRGATRSLLVPAWLTAEQHPPNYETWKLQPSGSRIFRSDRKRTAVSLSCIQYRTPTGVAQSRMIRATSNCPSQVLSNVRRRPEVFYV